MKPPRLFSSTVITLFVIIVLFPVFFMLVSPFWGGLEQTFDYRSLWDSRHLVLARNSLALAVGTTFFCLIVGVTLAFLIHRTDLWGRGIWGTVYIIPVLIPPYIHAIVWTHMNDFVKPILSLDIYSLQGGIFILTLSYFPFVTLMALSGLKTIDRNLEEASLLSHGKWYTLRRITLPLITPHIFSGAVFVFIFTIIDFGVPDILRVNVYPVEIFIQFSAFYDEGAATLLSLPLIFVTFLLLLLQKLYMKDRSYVQVSGVCSERVKYSLRRFNVFALGFCLLVVGLSVVVPITVLLKIAGALSNYIRVLSTSMDQIAYSLSLAFIGAIFVLFLAFPLSYIIRRSQIKTRLLLSFAALLPLAIPATTMGIGLIKVWNQPVLDAVYGSFLIIILGYIARFLPFSLLTLSSGLKQVNPRLEEAAFLSTPRWSRVIPKIIFPLLRNSCIAGFFIAFILSFGELGTTLLVIPPGRETVPIKIYNLMHYGADQMVAALCLIMILMILAFSGLFLIFHKRSVKINT